MKVVPAVVPAAVLCSAQTESYCCRKHFNMDHIFQKRNKYVHSCSEKWLLAACHNLSERPGLCGSWHRQWLTWAQALRERDLIKEMWHHAAVRKMFLKALAAQGFSNRCFTAIWVCSCVYVCEEGEILSKYIKVMLSRKFPIIANNLSWMDLNLYWCSCLIAKLGELLPLKEAKITVPLTTILHKRRNPDVHFLLLPKSRWKAFLKKEKLTYLFISLPWLHSGNNWIQLVAFSDRFICFDHSGIIQNTLHARPSHFLVGW